jgi:hypothetical protein
MFEPPPSPSQDLSNYHIHRLDYDYSRELDVHRPLRKQILDPGDVAGKKKPKRRGPFYWGLINVFPRSRKSKNSMATVCYNAENG